MAGLTDLQGLVAHGFRGQRTCVPIVSLWKDMKSVARPPEAGFSPLHADTPNKRQCFVCRAAGSEALNAMGLHF